MKLSERMIATTGKGSFFDDAVIQEVAKLEEENEALREALGNILAGSYNAEYVRIVAEQAIRNA